MSDSRKHIRVQTTVQDSEVVSQKESKYMVETDDSQTLNNINYVQHDRGSLPSYYDERVSLDIDELMSILTRFKENGSQSVDMYVGASENEHDDNTNITMVGLKSTAEQITNKQYIYQLRLYVYDDGETRFYVDKHLMLGSGYGGIGIVPIQSVKYNYDKYDIDLDSCGIVDIKQKDDMSIKAVVYAYENEIEEKTAELKLRVRKYLEELKIKYDKVGVMYDNYNDE